MKYFTSLILILLSISCGEQSTIYQERDPILQEKIAQKNFETLGGRWDIFSNEGNLVNSFTFSDPNTLTENFYFAGEVIAAFEYRVLHDTVGKVILLKTEDKRCLQLEELSEIRDEKRFRLDFSYDAANRRMNIEDQLSGESIVYAYRTDRLQLSPENLESQCE